MHKQPSDKDLKDLVKGCRKGRESSQLALYRHFYSYGMSICLRFCSNREAALEVLNDGFLKVFQRIDQYDTQQAFKPWLRRILINAAIDYHRKYNPKLTVTDQEEEHLYGVTHNEALEQLEYKDLLKLIQQLTPAYRMVFNLFVIEGLSHKEIALQLDISEGTSKSNLAKARQKMKEIIQDWWDVDIHSKR